MAILKTENLKKYYGKDTTLVKALNGVDLEVEKGEFLSIVGIAGKDLQPSIPALRRSAAEGGHRPGAGGKASHHPGRRKLYPLYLLCIEYIQSENMGI